MSFADRAQRDNHARTHDIKIEPIATGEKRQPDVFDELTHTLLNGLGIPKELYMGDLRKDKQ
jgi:hypothetical protein